MLWYPITARNPIERFLRRVRNSTLRKVLQVQLLPGHVEQGLLGSGLLIINPPWQSEQAIATAMSALATRLNDTQASASVEWLVAEQR
jgi:23S rRNA (adenine2030-N6)-methyltransferase